MEAVGTLGIILGAFCDFARKRANHFFKVSSVGFGRKAKQSRRNRCPGISSKLLLVNLGFFMLRKYWSKIDYVGNTHFFQKKCVLTISKNNNQKVAALFVSDRRTYGGQNKMGKRFTSLGNHENRRLSICVKSKL